MKNPYNLGFVFGPEFYGRQALVGKLLDEGTQCIYLVGNRRSGKTSMLKHLEKQASCVTIFLDLMSTLSGLLEMEMGASLIRQVKRKSKPHPFLAELSFPEPCSICDAIAILSEAAEAGSYNVLLLIDEAEKLLEMNADELARLRSALQAKRSLRTILAATQWLAELNEQRGLPVGRPFLFGFVTHYLLPLDDHEATDLIRQAQNPEGQVQASDNLIKRIRRLTGNHPFLIQMLCSQLFQSEGRLRPIEDGDLIVDDSLDDVFKSQYEPLSSDEQNILDEISEQGTASRKKLLQLLAIGRNRLRSGLHSLERLGNVRHSRAGYRVASHFLQTWLRMDQGRECAGMGPEVLSEAAKEVGGRPRSTDKPTERVDSPALPPTGRPITWLHLSDLHFTTSGYFDRKVVLEALYKDVTTLRKSNPALEKIDFIAFTGDLVYYGKEKEYANILEFFSRLLEVAGLSYNRLFIVPGNHDVDRDAIQNRRLRSRYRTREQINLLAERPAEFKELCDRQHSFWLFVQEHLADHYDFGTSPYYYTAQIELCGGRVGILGLNSSWLSQSRQDQGKLAIGEWMVHEAIEKVKDCNLRIALMHHPLSCLWGDEEGERQAVEYRLRQGCHFLLHGHFHEPTVRIEKDAETDRRVIVIPAGAVFKKRRWPNSYNLVQFDLGTRQGTVYLRRYDDQRQEWTADRSTSKEREGEFSFQLKS